MRSCALQLDSSLYSLQPKNVREQQQRRSMVKNKQNKFLKNNNNI